MGWGKLPSREFSLERIVRKQASMVEIVREFFSRVIFLGSNYTGGKQFSSEAIARGGTNFLGSNFLCEQSSRRQSFGGFVRVRIVGRGNFPWGQFSGGQSSRG